MTAIYLVKGPTGELLVEAKTKQSAINFVTRGTHSAKTLTAKETADCMKRGLEVVTASEPETETKPVKDAKNDQQKTHGLV